MERFTQFGQIHALSTRVCVAVFLLDLSISMALGDWPPSRFAGAVQALKRLLQVKRERFPDDRVACVAFNSEARVLFPFARGDTDVALIDAVLGQAHPEANTNMSKGLELAGSILLDELSGVGQQSPAVLQRQGGPDAGSSASSAPRDVDAQIILLTDGEHNQGTVDPVEVARDLKRRGIVIDAVGIGTPSDLDDTSLRQIASAGPDGEPSYCFIGDKAQLIRKVDELAHHFLRPI